MGKFRVSSLRCIKLTCLVIEIAFWKKKLDKLSNIIQRANFENFGKKSFKSQGRTLKDNVIRDLLTIKWKMHAWLTQSTYTRNLSLFVQSNYNTSCNLFNKNYSSRNKVQVRRIVTLLASLLHSCWWVLVMMLSRSWRLSIKWTFRFAIS